MPETQKYSYPFNDNAKIQNMSLSSNHQNMVYIMVDMTTGFDVTSLLQRNNNLLGRNFTGFTNFCNLVSTNHSTNASIPNLFGGFDHNPLKKNSVDTDIYQLTFLEYMKKSINNLISPFGNSHWNINLINPQYFHYDEKKGYWSSDWQAIEKDFEKYGLNCFSANDLCRFMLMNYPELYQEQKLPKDIYELDNHANDNVALDFLTKIKIEKTKNPCFMTFMTESNHRPFNVNQEGKYEVGQDTAVSAYYSTEGFLRKIDAFINYLKANNIYDNTMLCIVSDHGSCYGSLPVSDESYNFSGQNYTHIREINELFLTEANKEHKDNHFIRHFPTMLIKPYNMRHEIIYNHKDLHCNTDALSYISSHNPNVNFRQLKATKDPRNCSPEEIKKRTLPLMLFGADSLWEDKRTRHVQPTKKLFGHHSFLVSNTIYNPQEFWLINKVSAYEALETEFCNPDNTNDWISLEQYLQQKQKVGIVKEELLQEENHTNEKNSSKINDFLNYDSEEESTSEHYL